MKAAPDMFRPSSPSPLAEPALDMHRGAASPSDFGASGCKGEENQGRRGSSFPSKLLDKLKTFPLFKDAPQGFLAKVAAKLTLVQHHPQDDIVKEGDPALSMYWILKGTVRVTSTDGESVYAELTAGSFFGEIGILFNRPRTASVVACSWVVVGVLTADSLNSVLRSYPLIERRIRDEAQERLAMQEKKNKADIPIVRLSRSPACNKETASLRPLGFVPSPLSHLMSASRKSLCETIASKADNVDQTVSIQEFIKTVPIFKNLPPNIVHSLALGVEATSFMPFEYIYEKGQSGSDIYFITHGEVEVVDFSSCERVLARLSTGAYFGEMAFLDYIQGNTEQKRSASIRSVSSVELIVMRTEQLKTVCSKYPKVVEEMRKTANERKGFNESGNVQKSNPFTARNSIHDLHLKTPPAVSSQFNFSFEKNTGTSPVASKDSSAVSTPQSFFVNPNWNFDSGSLRTNATSRSVSPISFSDADSLAPPFSLKRIRSCEHMSQQRIRMSISEMTNQSLPRGPLDMVPPRNPSITTSPFQATSRKNSFQYMPHNKRVKLSSLAGRRRSSVLVSTGSVPDKVLLGAFEFLNLPDLMKLRLVSRRWRQLLYIAPNLFRKLDLTPWNTHINDKALISITDFVGARPKYIDVSNCFHVTDEGFSYLVNEVGMAGSINVFKMRCLWEVSAMAIMDLASPSVGKNLEEVDLSNCRKVSDTVVERLIGWSHNSTATALQLSRSEESYHNDAGSKRLRILNLGYCKHLTDSVMFHISIHANKGLESLDLTRCTTITDTGFSYWTYRSFPNLKNLSLKDCTFLSDSAIISLANAAPNLETLNLNFCCALSDLAIEALCQGCPKLRDLDLSFCGSAVSDSSLVSISLHMTQLCKLTVKGCVRVTRAGVDALLSGYCSLTYIDITQCRNAHEYPGRIPAQSLRVNPATKSAFISIGASQGIVEIVI